MFFQQISPCFFISSIYFQLIQLNSINITLFSKTLLQGVIHILHRVFHSRISLYFQGFHPFFPFFVSPCIAVFPFSEISFALDITAVFLPLFPIFFHSLHRLFASSEAAKISLAKFKRRPNTGLLCSLILQCPGWRRRSDPYPPYDPPDTHSIPGRRS